LAGEAGYHADTSRHSTPSGPGGRLRMRIGFRVLMAGALLSAPLLPGAVAQAGRGSGQGSVGTDDGAIKVVSINAVTKSDGSASGQIEMDDPSPIPDQDVDGTGEIDLSESPSGVRLIAKVNCLAVKGAAAVVGGLVVESDVPRYM